MRLVKHLIAIAVELGGKAGERLGTQLGYRIRDNTLLALFARVLLPAIRPPTVVGVDDFAFTKRQSYGTILVDLERKRPIALLKDRDANTLAQWLEQYPGIEALSRDRLATYRSGMNQGAPKQCRSQIAFIEMPLPTLESGSPCIHINLGLRSK